MLLSVLLCAYLPYCLLHAFVPAKPWPDHHDVKALQPLLDSFHAPFHCCRVIAPLNLQVFETIVQNGQDYVQLITST